MPLRRIGLFVSRVRDVRPRCAPGNRLSIGEARSTRIRFQMALGGVTGHVSPSTPLRVLLAGLAPQVYDSRVP